MKRTLISLLAGLAILTLPVTAIAANDVGASIGVGVGTGRIEIQEELKSGGIYTLPPILVFNTGTQDAVFSMEVTQNEKQSQLKPNAAWFSFSPSEFTLLPGRSEKVTPTIHLPLNTEPGEYFAYLEAHPAKTVKRGAANVGVAAATKLSFKVIPSNIFMAITRRTWDLYRKFAPWSYVASAIVVLAPILVIARKHLRFSIRVTKV